MRLSRPSGLGVILAAEVRQVLQRYQDDPKRRQGLLQKLQRARRYLPDITAQLKQHGLPPALWTVALVESGFDTRARSRAGAVGLWQFNRVTAKDVALRVDRWVDARLDAYASTRAACTLLAKLHARFGSWELALAAYNMGYVALLRAIRKYNTNDFWALARYEAGLPFETVRYVAHIAALALIDANRAAFALPPKVPAPSDIEWLPVRGGASLAAVARHTRVPLRQLVALNPALRRRRAPPPRAQAYPLQVPAGTRTAMHPRRAPWWLLEQEDSTTAPAVTRETRWHVRTEARRRTPANDPDRAVKSQALQAGPMPADHLLPFPDAQLQRVGHRRAFLAVRGHPTLPELARALPVSTAALCAANALDARARLQEGMVLRLFLPAGTNASGLPLHDGTGMQVVEVASGAHLDAHEAQQGRRRLRYTVRQRDSLRSIARRFGLSVGDIARINHFSRTTRPKAGDDILIYAPAGRARR
ncbi:MAG: transglycosylase SLT domain-containing protein [Polyangiales bacterium]